MDYYGTVNRKLTLLISKTIMTYGRNQPITAEMIEKHRKTVFITGLNGQISDTIFSMNPPDLPNLPNDLTKILMIIILRIRIILEIRVDLIITKKLSGTLIGSYKISQNQWR